MDNQDYLDFLMRYFSGSVKPGGNVINLSQKKTASQIKDEEDEKVKRALAWEDQARKDRATQRQRDRDKAFAQRRYQSKMNQHAQNYGMSSTISPNYTKYASMKTNTGTWNPISNAQRKAYADWGGYDQIHNYNSVTLDPFDRELKNDFEEYVALLQNEESYVVRRGEIGLFSGFTFNLNKWSALMAKIPLIQFNAPAERAKLLQYYIEIFNEIPSGSHMIRAYSLMEKIVMEKFNKAEILPDEKDIIKFDKMKTLALGNENVNERKTSFYMSVKAFMKIAKMELELPER